MENWHIESIQSFDLKSSFWFTRNRRRALLWKTGPVAILIAIYVIRVQENEL